MDDERSHALADSAAGSMQRSGGTDGGGLAEQRRLMKTAGRDANGW